jgi:hypothetical protein
VRLDDLTAGLRRDPVKFCRWLWPDVTLYREQRQILHSLRDNDETVIPAGHQLGKDFIAGAAALWFFLAHHPVRVVTTSVKDDHLRVLWGEIGRFIQSSRLPLQHKDGGPLVVNHRDIRKVAGGRQCPVSYLRGMVSAKGEGLAGHHAPHTLLVVDEASGAEDEVYDRGGTWAKRMLILGNPYGCANFFYKGVKQGDLPAPQPGRYYRKVIRVSAEMSPNVRLARAEERAGKAPSGEVIVPGVITWDEYCKRRATWDPVRQTIGLDGSFYEGAETLLFPPQWLDHAERLAESLRGKPRRAKGVGIDTGEGVANTAMAAVDELGLIELQSRRTPDTDVICREALAFARKHGLKAADVCFDRGGGGKQHADRLRAMGHEVRTVAFGESLVGEPQRRPPSLADKLEEREERYAYKNRRAQMYGALRLLLDPTAGDGWAIPAEYAELRRQLSPIPLTYDPEGRLMLLPKSKSGGGSQKTLVELLGCSPDESDAVVLAVHAMQNKVVKPKAWAM